MANRLHKRLMSERGASLSFALFLALVCAAVSSVVLAAATASGGQLAELGAYDQRYYSVSSAVALFQDELTGTSDGKVSYQFEEECKVTVEAPRDDASELDYESLFRDKELKAKTWPRSTEAMASSDTPDKLYFLYDMSKLVLYGPWASQMDTSLVYDSAFSTDWWTNSYRSGKEYKSFSYSVEPNEDSDTDFKNALLPVKVEAQLHEDWTINVVATSDPSVPGNHFNVYLSFEGDLDERTEYSEELKDTIITVDPSTGETKVTNIIEVTKKHMNTVTWSLRQVVPGRSF